MASETFMGLPFVMRGPKGAKRRLGARAPAHPFFFARMMDCPAKRGNDEIERSASCE
jgi:hypothetical protein